MVHHIVRLRAEERDSRDSFEPYLEAIGLIKPEERYILSTDVLMNRVYTVYLKVNASYEKLTKRPITEIFDSFVCDVPFIDQAFIRDYNEKSRLIIDAQAKFNEEMAKDPLFYQKESFWELYRKLRTDFNNFEYETLKPLLRLHVKNLKTTLDHLEYIQDLHADFEEAEAMIEMSTHSKQPHFRAG